VMWARCRAWLRKWASPLALAGLGITLGVLLGRLALRGVAWGGVWAEVEAFPPALFLLAVALMVIAFYLRALRWRLLLVGQQVRTFRLFLIETSATGLNNVSPIRLLAEPVQIGILTLRDGLNPGALLATMAVSRLFDLIVNSIIVWSIILLVPGLRGFAPLVGVAVGTSVLGIIVLFALGFGPRGIARFRRFSSVEGFAAAARAIRSSPSVAVLSFVLTAVYWTLVGLCGWLLTIGVGNALPVHLGIMSVLGAQFFATSVPGPPAAVGTFEFAARRLLELMELPTEPAITVAILAHALLFVTPMLFTIVVLPKEGLGSLTQLRAVIRSGMAPPS